MKRTTLFLLLLIALAPSLTYAQDYYEKYLQMAREAYQQGDCERAKRNLETYEVLTGDKQLELKLQVLSCISIDSFYLEISDTEIVNVGLVIDYLLANPDAEAEIIVLPNNDGSLKENEYMAHKNASKLKKHLIENGIAPQRLTIKIAKNFLFKDAVPCNCIINLK